MPAVLTVREAGSERRVVFETRAVVGRDPDCDVVLASRSVSRKHAIVERKGAAWVARDLGSANGLFVEGRRVAELPLESGTSLRFGDVEAVFDAGSGPRAASAERRAPPVARRRTRSGVLAAVATLSFAALVAATIWARYCDGAGPRSAAPAADTGRR